MSEKSETTSVMFSIRGDGRSPPTLQSSADQLGCDVASLDADYGVKVIDTMNHTYVVRGSVAHPGSHADPVIDVLGG